MTTIHVASLWAAATNCYVVARDRGGPAIVVDAPPDAAGLTALLKQADCYPAAVVVTHGHVDHVGAAGKIARDMSVAAYLHPDDDWLASDPAAQVASLFGAAGYPGDYEPPKTFVDLVDGSTLTLGGLELEVLHTPGHTPGHCCFMLPSEGILFSGDQLFAGSIGRTDLPGGDQEALMRSMKERIVPLPADTDVLPGHGPTTTLAAELRSNPFLQGI